MNDAQLQVEAYERRHKRMKARHEKMLEGKSEHARKILTDAFETRMLLLAIEFGLQP